MEKLARNLPHLLHKWSFPILAIAVALGMAMCCSNALAQSGAGSIQGTVTDSTGAVIPGASVHVVNQATNVAADTKSTRVGFYQVPDLFTGTYVITINAPGMKTYKTSIELLVNQTAVINASLTAGSVTQQVEVSASTVQLTTTESGTISSTLENARINQLPMNGRNILSLSAESTPGLATCGLGICPNGLLGQAMEFVADGVTTTDREFGGEQQGQSQMPDPDSVQEVQMETTGVGAEYATPAVGILTTKSGTNSIHGSLFETARNNYIGIARARSNPSNFSAPHYVRNEFGASVGGPIVIPKVYNGKDKSFWFFAFERYSLASSTYENANVTPLAMRAGDFSGLVNSSGVLQTLFDPATTTNSANCPFTGAANPYCRTQFNYNGVPNTINPARLSPVSKTLFDILPPPTTSANPLVTTNLLAVDPSNVFIPNTTFRLDHSFNEANRAYLRYTEVLTSNVTLENNPTNAPATIAADGLPAQASGVQIHLFTQIAGAIGYTHVFSPTFFAETVASQQWWYPYESNTGNPTFNYEKLLGLPNNFGEGGLPYFENLTTVLHGNQFLFTVSQIVSNLDENLTKTTGKHQLQFGGRYRHERFGLLPDEFQDAINFGANATALENPASGANYTALTNTGYADGDMYLGAASSYSVNEEPPYAHIHDMEFDAYVQDNYHLNRNLTLNIGLRYEAHPATWEKFGMLESFDLKNDALVLSTSPANLISEGYTTPAIIANIENDGGKIETPQQAGMPSTLLRNNDFTFGPRAGFAWQPFGSSHGTVIRGAYGRFIYPVPVRSTFDYPNRDVPLTANYSQSYTSAAQSPDGLPNYLIRNPQTVIMGVNSSNVVNSSSTNAILPGISIFNLNPDYTPTVATQTNFTIEQPLKGNTALRLSWLYSHGSNLDQEYEYNYAPTTYVWEMETGTIPPTGGPSTIGTNQYATTATLPYDKITWGSGSVFDQTSGWSNDNQFQANYQRLFHRGVAYQINYAWSKPMRVGGNFFRNAIIYPNADYVGNTQGAANTYMTPAYGPVIAPALPPPPPAGAASYAYYRAMNKYQNYIVDTAQPKQHIQFNGIVDLPFGRGKRFLGSSNRFLDEVVGGFQLAGDGSITSQDFIITATNWGLTNPLKTYKHNAPITDCRSGVCYKEFEWFNGYVAPGVINAASKGVSGLPSSWAPYQTPIDNTPGTKYYGSNEVNITLPNGTTNAITYQPSPSSAATGSVGSNPFARSVLNGPMNYTVDLSIYKVFPITEKVNLRFNMDAFNALNVQGFNNPNATDGTENTLSSYNTPRQVQFTLRLTF